jgi:hypothetical protein
VALHLCLSLSHLLSLWDPLLVFHIFLNHNFQLKGTIGSVAGQAGGKAAGYAATKGLFERQKGLFDSYFPFPKRLMRVLNKQLKKDLKRQGRRVL